MTFGEAVEKIRAMPVEELRRFVADVVGAYFDEFQADGELDTEKEVDGADLVDNIYTVITCAGLWPEEVGE